MNEVRVGGEPIDLIRAAFRGMEAQRASDGWVSATGRLDRVPGEALMRALQRTEALLPRRLGTTREQHRAAALDEIARQCADSDDRASSPAAPSPTPKPKAKPKGDDEGRRADRAYREERLEVIGRTKQEIDVVLERFRAGETVKPRLSLVPCDGGARR